MNLQAVRPRGSEIVQNLDEEELAEPKLQVHKPCLYLDADGSHEKCQIIVYHTIHVWYIYSYMFP